MTLFLIDLTFLQENGNRGYYLKFALLGVQRKGIKKHRADEGDMSCLAEIIKLISDIIICYS